MQTINQISALPGSLAQPDRLTLGTLYGVANGSGAAGATVSVAVVWPPAGMQSGGLPIIPPLPANGAYFVDVELPADYTVFITAKTTTGFTVNLQPRLPANSIAAGTFNVQITA
jgi:hypothetical protein